MLRSSGILVVAVITRLAVPLPAVAQPVDRGARADSAVTAFMTAHRVPAMSVAVSDSGRIVYRRAYGLADLENRVPATPETVFRIASVTKPLTAVGVLRLADTGRLDLDAPIQEYCPAFPEKRWPVTARQLMAHLGGVRDYTRIEGGVWKVVTSGGTQTGSSTVYVPTIDDAVAVFAGDSLVSEPGTRYGYSNWGYVLLGCAIEGASGRPYAEFMAVEVFAPLGMGRTQPDDAYRIIENRARPYQMRTEETANWWWFIPQQHRVMEIGRLYNARFEDSGHKLPAGGMLSTPADLVRFAAGVIGGAYLSETTKREMLTRQETRGGEATGWTLGWSVDGDVVGLSGGQPGVSARLSTIPSAQFAVAIATNRDLVPTEELFDALRAVWDHEPPP